MSFYVLIPARLESTRLKNKMLLDLEGVPMIVRTAQQAKKSGAEQVLIATDNQTIAETVTEHGFQVVMTGSHPTGTDRLAEASEKLQLDAEEIIVNVQGDEPLIPPRLISRLARQLQRDKQASMATAAAPITESQDFFNPNIVKVVCNIQQHALYFSRAPIPWDREQFDAHQIKAHEQIPNQVLQHIGIYAYRNHFLQQFPYLTRGVLEQIESLEQLRTLEHGYSIGVHLSEHPPARGVDTQADLDFVRNYLQQQNAKK